MRRRRAAVLGMLCLVGAVGCGDSGGRAAVVTGTVTTRTGAPVGDATVRVLGTTVSAVTGADGRYQLERVPAGNHSLTAELLANNRWSYGESPLFAFAGGTIELDPIVLRDLGGGSEAGEVTGRVLDTSGEPQVAATVQLRSAADTLTTRTGPTGGFAFTGAPTGAYQLTARAGSGTAERIASVEVGLGANPQARVAGPFDLVVTAPASLGGLEGQVTAANGRPAAGAILAVRVVAPGAGAGPAYYTATSDTAGRYVFPSLPAVNRDVTVSCTASGHLRAAATVRLRAGLTLSLDFALTSSSGGDHQPPTLLDRLAVTYPTGAGAQTARGGLLADRLGDLAGPGGSRLPPAGSQIQVLFRFDPDTTPETATTLLYRGLRPSPTDDYVLAGSTADPAAGLLLDTSRALSVETRYYYRLATRSAGGRQSALTEPLEVLPLAPLAAVAPRDDATGQPLSGIDYTWQAVARARSYQVAVYTELPTSGQTPLRRSPILPGGTTRWTWDGPDLAPGADLYWQVVASNEERPAVATAVSIGPLRRFTTAP